MECMPEVIPTDDFKVYVYFDDGSIKLYDASEDIKQILIYCIYIIYHYH